MKTSKTKPSRSTPQRVANNRTEAIRGQEGLELCFSSNASRSQHIEPLKNHSELVVKLINFLKTE